MGNVRSYGSEKPDRTPTITASPSNGNVRSYGSRKPDHPLTVEAIATMLRPIAIILTLETSILSMDLIQEVVKEYMRRYHYPTTYEGQRVDLRGEGSGGTFYKCCSKFPLIDQKDALFLARMSRSLERGYNMISRVDHEIVGELTPVGDFTVEWSVMDDLAFQPPWMPITALPYSEVGLIVTSESPPPYILEYTLVSSKKKDFMSWVTWIPPTAIGNRVINSGALIK